MKSSGMGGSRLPKRFYARDPSITPPEPRGPAHAARNLPLPAKRPPQPPFPSAPEAKRRGSSGRGGRGHEVRGASLPVTSARHRRVRGACSRSRGRRHGVRDAGLPVTRPTSRSPGHMPPRCGAQRRSPGDAYLPVAGPGAGALAPTSSAAISRSLNFCTIIEGVIGKSSTKKTRLGTL